MYVTTHKYHRSQWKVITLYLWFLKGKRKKRDADDATSAKSTNGLWILLKSTEWRNDFYYTSVVYYIAVESIMMIGIATIQAHSHCNVQPLFIIRKILGIARNVWYKIIIILIINHGSLRHTLLPPSMSWLHSYSVSGISMFLRSLFNRIPMALETIL